MNWAIIFYGVVYVHKDDFGKMQYIWEAIFGWANQIFFNHNFIISQSFMCYFGIGGGQQLPFKLC